jgi:hypothetical protein
MNFNQYTETSREVSNNERPETYYIRRRRQRQHKQMKRHKKKIAKQKEENEQYELEVFKCNLEASIRQHNNIYEFIADVKLFGTLTSVELYATELGCPTTCSYDDYFWRIIAIIYYMFKEINVERIDLISNAYMSHPEEFYFNYCADVHSADLKRNTQTNEEAKEIRMKNIVIETEYSEISVPKMHLNDFSGCSENYVKENSFESKRGYNSFECPICYETYNNKLNSFETDCGHKYCESCFTNYMMKLDITMSASCPLFRNNLIAVNCYTEIIISKQINK